MIGLGLLDTLDGYRMAATDPAQSSLIDPDLLIQIQVFEHYRAKDDEQLDASDEKPLYDLFSVYFQKVRQ